MATVSEILSKQIKNPSTAYFYKDLSKFKDCNKFIGRGVGSTGLYADILNEVDFPVNYRSGYLQSDIVAVSINGRRPYRIGIDAIKPELMAAIKGRATIVTDSSYNRDHDYNIGEQEVASFLVSHNYTDSNNNGHWTPKND